eukprot:NODE_4810_length_748_cov_62.479871_g4787_i0.p1 GENE.NODE_4810_length_748_cov_62.479871_g4787_i0~~NODE_4810_length_748_cov_62.479871_g4787_i0.p1  ORF type:complete len:211 (+),score=21.88 NODE_4810_length_748_cov_62.479871_g4787_i0:100-732(+)
MPPVHNKHKPTIKQRSPMSKPPVAAKIETAVRKKYRTQGPKPPAKWFTVNEVAQRPPEAPSPMPTAHFDSAPFPINTSVSTSRAQAASPDTLVMCKRYMDFDLSSKAKASFVTMHRKVVEGCDWSLAPGLDASTEQTDTQMEELESFVPAGEFNSLVRNTPHTYKLGKWSEDAQIVWDYHVEQPLKLDADLQSELAAAMRAEPVDVTTTV